MDQTTVAGRLCHGHNTHIFALFCFAGFSILFCFIYFILFCRCYMLYVCCARGYYKRHIYTYVYWYLHINLHVVCVVCKWISRTIDEEIWTENGKSKRDTHTCERFNEAKIVCVYTVQWVLDLNAVSARTKFIMWFNVYCFKKRQRQMKRVWCEYRMSRLHTNKRRESEY